jgi:hypothetical protein
MIISASADTMKSSPQLCDGTSRIGSFIMAPSTSQSSVPNSATLSEPAWHLLSVRNIVLFLTDCRARRFCRDFNGLNYPNMSAAIISIALLWSYPSSASALSLKWTSVRLADSS